MYSLLSSVGNGWNNQRIVIEMALLFAKILNHTLIVHPISSHSLGEKMKRELPPNNRFGYITYNKMAASTLLPLSSVLDLQLMSKLVPVIEINSSHSEFLQNYFSQNTKWRHICHSLGYGYWLDCQPLNQAEVLLTKQIYTSKKDWRYKCKEEQAEFLLQNEKPIVKYVSDLANDSSDVIYFNEGCLFGIELRFMEYWKSIQAREWIKEYVRYKSTYHQLADAVRTKLGNYNAIHVRRIKHISRSLTTGHWILEMLNNDFTRDTPIYVATDETNLKWLEPLIEAGFKLYFASNFMDFSELSHIHKQMRKDVMGMYEQMVCIKAELFLPSPHSTFSNYIVRERGETDIKNRFNYILHHASWAGDNI